MPTPAPFLRWAGGKRRLLPVLHAALPRAYDGFYEPFLGGGALLFSLPAAAGRAVVNDSNLHLAAAYRVLRDAPDALVAALQRLADGMDEARFYELRAAQPATDLERAARFIAYNRTGFNGLFRVNSKGGWNTPWGKLANPTVCNEPLLRVDSQHLAGVKILCGSYVDAVASAGAGDFVYLDPPYLPLSATSSFSRYAADDFTLADHEQLAATAADLTSRGVFVMLSNSDTPLTREVFAGLHLHTVQVRRSISAAASSRQVVTEVLAVNYGMDQMRDPDTFAALTV